MRLIYVDAIPGMVNNAFQNKEPWQIVTMTSTVTLATVWLWNFIFCQDKSKNKILEQKEIFIYIIIYFIVIEFIMYFDDACVTGLLERGKKQLFKLARYIPSIRDQINKELTNINASFEKDVVHRLKETSFIVDLPKKGLSNEEILNLVKQFVHLGKLN